MVIESLFYFDDKIEIKTNQAQARRVSSKVGVIYKKFIKCIKS